MRELIMVVSAMAILAVLPACRSNDVTRQAPPDFAPDKPKAMVGQVDIAIDNLTVLDPKLSDVSFNDNKTWMQVNSKLKGVYVLWWPILCGSPAGGHVWFTDTVNTKGVTEMALATCKQQGFTDMQSLSYARTSKNIEIINSIAGFNVPKSFHVFYIVDAELTAVATPPKSGPAR